jgi:hypothetical protein
MLQNELAETLPLDGTWDFSLGSNAAWGTIQVSGCWEAQGFDMRIDGPATYRKEFQIPASWRGKQLQLEFGAVSYACTVSLNGAQVGEHRGLWTPFACNITSAARCGESNILEVTVYKPGSYGDLQARYPMRSSLAGFIPDIATTFGGLWQSVRLRAFSTALEDARVTPSYTVGMLHVHSKARVFPSQVPAPAQFAWSVEVSLDGQVVCSHEQPIDLPAGPGAAIPSMDLALPVPGFQPWSPEKPNLYKVEIRLLEHGQPLASLAARTGFRALSADGSQLLLNGESFMARGILSWGWEPERIAPTYTPEQARDEMRRVRALGFNLVKLCLLVPSPAYFNIADEEGMLLWEELPMWLPEVNDDLRRQAPLEYQEIAGLLQHHPSVALYSLGCELSQSVDSKLLSKLDQAVRSQVSDVLLCDNSGSGESYGGLDFDFADFTDYHPYYDIHYFEPLLDNWRRDWQKPRPWIFGEFCDSDTFRHPQTIIDAHGGQRPWWLTEQNPVTAWRSESIAMLAAQERLAQADPFASSGQALPFTIQELEHISYAQSHVTRKYTLESLRRRSGIGGYVVTGLRDTPISTSGIWDDFARPKWQADEFLQVNGETVLSLDAGRRRQWRFGGDRPDRLDVHNFWSGEQAAWHITVHTTAPGGFEKPKLLWKLLDEEGRKLAADALRGQQPVVAGQPTDLGVLNCRLPEVRQAARSLRLEVTLEAGDQEIHNQWPVWVYAPLTPPSPGLGIYDPMRQLDEAAGSQPPGDWLDSARRVETSQFAACDFLLLASWTPELLPYLNAGGKALYLQQGSGPLPAKRCPFWREAVKLFYPHPTWQSFPHQGYADMQFFGIAGDCAIQTDLLEAAVPGIHEIQPVLRRLDAREFLVSDYILEARVGKGQLLICTLRLQGGAGSQPNGWLRNVAGAALLQAMMDSFNLAKVGTKAHFGISTNPPSQGLMD